MSNVKDSPSSDVLNHFGISNQAQRLPGGQNTTWIADNIVLKPTTRNNHYEEWTFRIQSLLSGCQVGFRVAEPLQIGETFVYKGWTAVHLLTGIEDNDLHARIHEIVQASRAIHTVLADLVMEPPAMLELRSDRWCYADKFAWDEVTVQDIPNFDAGFYERELRSYVERLNTLKRESRPKNVVCQLVHGDLSGNILFSPDEQPAILDFDYYWRPVEYAVAIFLADGMTWQGFSIEEVKVVGWDELRYEMLVRALIFRIVQYAIDLEEGFVEKNWKKIDAERAVRLLELNTV